MGKFKFRLTTMVAALAVTVTTYVPVQAMPLPAAPAAQGLVTDVQYRDRWDRRYDRRWDRREARRAYPRGVRAGYYNRYRG